MKRFAPEWIAAAGTTLFMFAACSTGGQPQKKEMSHTERAQMMIEIANGALREGDPTTALENLMKAEREDPNLPELHHSMALAYYAKKNPELALAEARKAVQLKPDYSDANNTLGKLLMDQGRADEAIPYLTRAASDNLYREAFKPLTNLGILHYRRGEYAQANQFLTRAIDSSPTQACVAHYYRGHVELRESHFQSALKDYDSAGKRLCANFADAHLAMGIAYERSKQYEQARKKYLEIENKYPNSKVAEQAMTHLRNLP